MTSKLLSDIGMCLNSKQTVVFERLLTKVDYKPESYDVKSSCGMSIVIIPRKGYTVYQFYLSDATFEKIQAHLSLIQSIDGFVKIIDVYPDFNTIEFEKVEPIIHVEIGKISVKPFVSLEKLMNHVCQTLVDLKMASVCHRDLTLDNIGYSSAKDKYLVYDFETMSVDDGEEECSKNRDLHTFLESIKFHKLQVVE